MKKNDSRYDIADSETLFRLAASPSFFDEEDEVSPLAFSLYHKDEWYVSMMREKFIKLDDVITFGPHIKRWITPADTFCGVLIMNAGDIRKTSSHVELISCYTPSFEAHAGIVYWLDNQHSQKLIHTGTEVQPAWLLAIQTKLSESVLAIAKV